MTQRPHLGIPPLVAQTFPALLRHDDYLSTDSGTSALLRLTIPLEVQKRPLPPYACETPSL